MAYTTTSTSKASTIVGTSGDDTLASAATATVTINSYQGNDSVTLAQAMTSASIGRGGGKDTVTLAAATLKKKVDITLGDGSDTFKYYGSADGTGTTTKDDGISVGGQGGADTLEIDGDATLNSYFAGGKGDDTFTVTALGGKNNTVVGGSEDDTITVTAAGTSLFVNGQKGEDTISLTTPSALTTVRGGSEDDSITNANVAIKIFGDNGADTIVDGTAASTIEGGGGADTISAGLGADVITGGLGKDDFKINDVATGGGSAEVSDIKDFTVADDQIGAFSLADLKGLSVVSDVVSAAAATTSIAAADKLTLTNISGAYDLGATGTGTGLTISSDTAFTTATLVTAFETGGSHALIAGSAFTALDAFIVFYDDNVDTYAASVNLSSGGTWSDNATSTDIAVTNLVKLSGVSDASTITSSQTLAFAA